MPDSSTSVPERTAFFVSDGTGITAETFGHSILSQFEGLRLRQVRLPFIDELTKAEDAVERINQQGIIDGNRPIVFSTLVNPRINSIVRTANAMFMDLIAAFVEPLEAEFGIKSTHTIGRFHSVAESDTYKKRIEAIHFAMSHDDGQMHKELDQSDVILVGVSRSGKTPTSLYRRPGSRYASLETCRTEVNQAEAMMRRENIPWLSSTTKSIEEIATTVMTLLDQP